MEVRTLSGATVTKLDENQLRCMVDSGQSVTDLKQHLATQLGYSRFRQRLLSEDAELQDDMPLRPFPGVQMVILDFCAPTEALKEKLHVACRENRAVEVQRLLRSPLDPHAYPDGCLGPFMDPALCAASQSGHLEVVRLLLEAKADANAATFKGKTALLFAAENGHLEVVHLLLQAANNAAS